MTNIARFHARFTHHWAWFSWPFMLAGRRRYRTKGEDA